MIALILGTSAIGAAVTDLRWRRIPNWLILVTAAAGILMHTLEAGPRGAGLALGGVLVGVALLVLPYLLGGIGAGDLKLLGAFGAVVGPKGIVALFLCAAIFGGLLAAIALLVARLRKHDREDRALTDGTGTFSMNGLNSPSHSAPLTIPYGVAIACGALVLAGLSL